MFIGVLLVVPRKPAKTKKVETTWKKKRKRREKKGWGNYGACMCIYIYLQILCNY